MSDTAGSRLRTTTVGWFPRPQALRHARALHADGELGDDELRAEERRTMAELVRLQEELGLDLLVDGQADRGDMVSFFAERLDGMETGGLVRCFGNRYYHRPRVTGPVGRREPLTVECWQAAQAVSPLPVKAILTGPYTLMDWSFDEHYATREACCLAFAEVVREEAEALVAAGAVEIEIDEPAISARPEELPLAARALAVVTAPLRGRARTWTHVCYGDLAPVLTQVLALPVDGVLLELSHATDELLGGLAKLPPDKILGAGIVDVQTREVEGADVLRKRVAKLLERVPADRLWLAPDAALRTLDEASLRAKLAGLVAAASV